MSFTQRTHLSIPAGESRVFRLSPSRPRVLEKLTLFLVAKDPVGPLVLTLRVNGIDAGNPETLAGTAPRAQGVLGVALRLGANTDGATVIPGLPYEEVAFFDLTVLVQNNGTGTAEFCIIAAGIGRPDGAS